MSLYQRLPFVSEKINCANMRRATQHTLEIEYYKSVIEQQRTLPCRVSRLQSQSTRKGLEIMKPIYQILQTLEQILIQKFSRMLKMYAYYDLAEHNSAMS